ncbi:MAG: H(+)-transporting V0 sector ATPase subunit e [Cirrosporium novae-zelandiae]|nr:MAG: H(+)-transporting V0 sector ATPase subunit e [Cirrosporium novae-zelandiae]
MASFWNVIFVLAVIAAICLGVWKAPLDKFVAKHDQTTTRVTLVLGLSVCYLMWAITFLAQLHPLIQPRRNDLRPEVEDIRLAFN